MEELESQDSDSWLMELLRKVVEYIKSNSKEVQVANTYNNHIYSGF